MRSPRRIALNAAVVVAILLAGLITETSAASGATAPRGVAGAGSVTAPGTAVARTLAVAPSAPGALISVTPARIADSRTGQQIPGAIPAFGSVSVKVAGRGGIPAGGVATAVLNLTVASPLSDGYVTAWATGRPRPNTSNLNFSTGRDIATGTIVPGRGRRRDPAVQRLADPHRHDHRRHRVHPGRCTERTGCAGSGDPDQDRRLPPRSADRPDRPGRPALLRFRSPGSAECRRTGVAAAVLTVTVAQPQAFGYITVWPGGLTRTNTSALSLIAGKNIATTTLVPVGRDGSVQLFNGSLGANESDRRRDRLHPGGNPCHVGRAGRGDSGQDRRLAPQPADQRRPGRQRHRHRHRHRLRARCPPGMWPPSC